MTALRTAATGTAPDVVDALVESGIVAPEDRERALGVVAARLPERSQPTGSAGNLVATLLGYVGGSSSSRPAPCCCRCGGTP